MTKYVSIDGVRYKRAIDLGGGYAYIHVPPRTQAERFTDVLRVLRDIPVDQFNMGFWWHEGGDPDDKDTLGAYDDSAIPGCGTSGCVIGHCGHDPEFIAEGFAIEKDEDGAFVPFYGGEHSFKAVALYLNIPSYDVSYLFVPSYYSINPTSAAFSLRSQPMGKELVIERITAYARGLAARK